MAVKTIHEERIVHSDLKPGNFLLVRGSLKLIDFGIAKAIMNDTTNIQRDSQGVRCREKKRDGEPAPKLQRDREKRKEEENAGWRTRSKEEATKENHRRVPSLSGSERSRHPT